ncbi:LOW QUALITY PROTEIN: FH protein interacting protein FIP2-like [Pyrus x bretschneideri]|uniref:LOW QUALITY PROTEIN: FH protein interacting protein FIP2-like n=1 Tax=Pyrus x bretschneideri TaxID=225117 RepID=UPI00202EB3B5|nr:LOW QUALITY PROTEIN: FH protein interacting protein FIP2-like [Pyrus x bretschneideri]
MPEDWDSSSLVHLNVGGKKFSTTVSTLTQRQPDSNLAAMFSVPNTLRQDKKGYLFIDRDGEHFRHILNWLRDRKIPILEASQYAELVMEAKYYQLLGLLVGILDVLNSRQDKKLDADFTRAEVINYIHSGKWTRGLRNRVHYFRGVNLSGLNLSKLDLSNVDFANACLRHVCFSGADILNSNFNGADAEGATFDNANLRSSTFSEANLRGASFVGAKNFDLAGASCVEDCKGLMYPMFGFL